MFHVKQYSIVRVTSRDVTMRSRRCHQSTFAIHRRSHAHAISCHLRRCDQRASRHCASRRNRTTRAFRDDISRVRFSFFRVCNSRAKNSISMRSRLRSCSLSCTHHVTLHVACQQNASDDYHIHDTLTSCTCARTMRSPTCARDHTRTCHVCQRFCNVTCFTKKCCEMC